MSLRTEIKNSIRGWRAEEVYKLPAHYNRFHQAFFVLHYCRVLQDLHEGRITSKREGVEWAKSHLDPKWYSLIDHCWQDRDDSTHSDSEPADPEVFEQVIAFSEYASRLGAEFQLPIEE